MFDVAYGIWEHSNGYMEKTMNRTELLGPRNRRHWVG